MAFAIESTLRNLQSFIAQEAGLAVQIGEPKMPPGGTIHAAIFMSEVRVPEVTDKTIEVHEVIARFYHVLDLQSPDQEAPEIDLAALVQRVAESMLGDADLGGTVRNIDAAGQYGTGISTLWGYETISGTTFRIADMTIPIIIDDSASVAA
jgi:hypothetical protein